MAPSTAISLLLSIISLKRYGNYGFGERKRKKKDGRRERDMRLPSTDLVIGCIVVVVVREDENWEGRSRTVVELFVIPVVTVGEWR